MYYCDTVAASMKGDRLGEFEELTLLAIHALDAPVYAVPVQRFIARATGRDVVMGAVYAALDRLEQKGLVRSTLGEPTPERGGKRKRLLSATPEGTRVLKDLRRVRDRIWRAIEEKR
jgi:DNA-binding PadR family transcriptional regulator